MKRYLEILRHHGESTLLYEHSLGNAMRLADGPLPIALVLQEPCNLADEVDYDTMVYGDEEIEQQCQARIGTPTLQEVEKLIAEVTEGRYGLEDVSVFDLNTLLSPDLQDLRQQEEKLPGDIIRAHNVFWDMVLAKSPKVILVLTCQAGRSALSRVRLLWSSLKCTGKVKKIMLYSGNGSASQATVVRGFHPSVYLRDDVVEDRDWSPDEVQTGNDMLRMCFAKAFSELQGEGSGHLEDAELREAWVGQVNKRSQAEQRSQVDMGCLAEEMAEKLSIAKTRRG